MSSNKISSTRVLKNEEAPVFRITNREADSIFTIVCDHASNLIPQKLNTLGMKPDDLEKHIAVDIGALKTAQVLSERLSAPLIHTCYSRLVIDVNRPTHTTDSIPERSDGIVIPGNRNLSEAERLFRKMIFFDPYHEAIHHLINERIKKNGSTTIISIHSFTPELHGITRPWNIGITYDRSRQFAKKIIELLSVRKNLTIGDNLPYPVNRDSDYTVPIHGDDRGLRNVLFEIRQDQLMKEEDSIYWGEFLADILVKVDQ